MKHISKPISLAKILIVITLFAFTVVPVFALVSTLNNHNNANMSVCLLMIEDSIDCKMNVGDHLSKWQQIFVGLGTSNLVLIVFFLVSLVGASSFIRFNGIDPPSLLYNRYINENNDLKLLDYLLVAFRKGILHSKIYA